MASFKIEGGRPLKGEVTPIANKNSVLKLIPACILTDETVILKNVPKTSDVRIMFAILKKLGGKVTYMREHGQVKINCKDIHTSDLPFELISKIKASYLFIGPLLQRFGKVIVPEPGGCNFGYRRLNPFFEGLEQLGVKVQNRENHFELTTDRIKNRNIWLTFPAVTATENLILSTVLSSGTGEIYNAASEPHTQDLCNMLNQMGANIEGIGTNKLIISGVDKLNGTEYEVIPDHLDVGAYIAAAVMTKGELLIHNAIPEHMKMILMMYERVGVKVEIQGDKIFVPANQNLKIGKTVQGQMQYVESLPWPNFPTDLLPIMAVLALSAKGEMFVFNKMEEFQLLFVQELMKMGANVFVAGTQRIITKGAASWRGAVVESPYIIQAAMALVLAGLAATGTTIVKNIEPLNRRYEDLDIKFNALGAKISKIR